MAAGSPRPDPALGVFDTLLVRDGRAVDLQEHVDRLARSVHELYGVPVEAAALGPRMSADAESLGTARVRTSYDPTTGQWEIDATRIEEPGLEARTLVLRRLTDGLGSHKWRDRRLVSVSDEADDVLLVDNSDLVLECGTANVFALVDGQVLTPPLDGRILPGTVRARVLELLRERHEATVERPITLGELATASEVFTSSSIRGVQPVAECAEVGRWPVGPRTRWLRDRLGGRAPTTLRDGAETPD